MKRSLIEDIFPIRKVSDESTREKLIRLGNIATFHTWWARRPTAASRSTIYASLVDENKIIKDRSLKEDFVATLAKWENRNNFNIIDKAKKDILESNGGIIPKILDPFSGGGSIPLEGLRLGCEVFATDYNPVSTIILKSLLEFPNKFGKLKQENTVSDIKLNFVEDVKKWGQWIFHKSKNEIGELYTVNDDDDSIPVCFIWAKTILCQNPSCGVEIPLFKTFWLANTTRKKIAIQPEIKNSKISFKLIGDGFQKIPKNFNPSIGTVNKSIVTCSKCTKNHEGEVTRKLFREKKSGEKLIVIVTYQKGKAGKNYRLATKSDEMLFNKSKEKLKKKEQILFKKWGIEPVPNEPLETPLGREYIHKDPYFGFSRIFLFGYTNWGDLFNDRQKLMLITFVENIRLAFDEMSKEYNIEYAKAITTILSLQVDKLASSSNIFCRWVIGRETMTDIFARHSITMMWDYSESNVFGGKTRSFKSLFSDIINVLESSVISSKPVSVQQCSATKLPFEDNFFDAVFTDPPYYDNIPYSYLSDFFYVWLKRSIGDLYPDLFLSQLTPKVNEVIAELPILVGGANLAKDILKSIKTKKDFEHLILLSFNEIYRVLKDNGIVTIVYAHKSNEGWETLINSILKSGLVVTAAWPIHTEMSNRINAQKTASLSSSIYMVCRKWQKEEIGFYRDVKVKLEKHLNNRLDYLWDQGISGADFFISAIGSSIEVFGKYNIIIDDNDNQISVLKLLEDVRKIATDFAIHQVLKNGFGGEISLMTRFYILWRWAYGETKVPFDSALKLSQSIGINLSDELNKGFIKKENEFVIVLGPTERKLNEDDSFEMIDILHMSILRWKNNKREEMMTLLKNTGFGNSDVFFKIAQAISDSNPGSNESKLLDGFLAGKSKIMEQMEVNSNQTKLD